MQNRRFLREKILQSLYAFYQNEVEDIRYAEKHLVAGANKLYELYIRLASVIVELSNFAQQRIEEGKQKHVPTEAEKNPNLRFVQNRFVEQLRTNPTFIRKFNEYKISWKHNDDLFRHLYQVMLKSQLYQAYMDDPESSYEKDKAFICGFFKRKISTNSNLFHHFDESCIYWSIDFNNVAFWLLKSLKLAEEHSEIIVNEDQFTIPEDLNFAKRLFEMTIIHSDEYTPIIEHYLTNWEFDRTPIVDVLIIKMAIAELCHFPSIPVKVTLNEYVEIVKQYSTENSRIFVNGLLNKLSEDFVRDGKIRKSGRGLIDS